MTDELTGRYSFNKAYFNDQDIDNWESFNGRKTRAAIYWAYYNNTAYDSVLSWSETLKSEYALYRSIRSIASPANTVVAHFRDNVWGGVLDPLAGDEGAIPIFTENDGLREVIADIWKYSQWSKNKNLMVTKGAVYGDVGLRVQDNIKKNRVYLEIVDPSKVKNVELDAFGNVKSYTLEYKVPNPETLSGTVTYREEITRSGEFVIYETFMNDKAYAYPDKIDQTGTPKSTWRERYGFVPFVWVNHISTGSRYGWSELYPGLTIFREIDDQVSLLSDQIRKTIIPAWFFKGLKREDIDMPAGVATASNRAPWKQRLNAIFSKSTEASAEAMIAKLDIEGVIEHIKQLTETLEKQYPELILHKLRTEGAVLSGRALRVAQKPAAARVIERRNSYDAALVTGLQMAIAIGGWRGIYPGFDLTSYDKGDLEFKVSDREVFELDPEDQIEITKKTMESLKLATESGISVEGFFRTQGWTEEKIAELGPVNPTMGAIIQTEEINE